MRNSFGIVATTLALAAGLPASGFAQDTLTLAIGQRGNWENAAPHLGQEAGFFEKHGLKLELLYTQGGGETMQAVISRSADIGIGVGTLGIMSAYSKGAPVRAIANSTTGADDLYWYVRADSPIQSMQDADDATIAYSSNGSSTNIIALGLIREFDVNAEPVATGSPSGTFTQVMSGQVDIGWSSPPFGVEAVENGETRIVARGSDVPSVRNQTVRMMVANAATVDEKADQIDRFLAAYAETLEWMYSDPAALEAYAEWVEITPELAKTVRDRFYPIENLRIDRLEGMEAAMADAVNLGFLTEPLSDEQLSELFRYSDTKAE
jgi:NitT/TauT family transport system substrate-binding protein